MIAAFSTADQLRLRRSRVAVIGYAIAQKLFPFTDPLDKWILLDDRKYQVVAGLKLTGFS